MNGALGTIYTEHQSQHCHNSVMMLVILLSLKRLELLTNGIATHFRVPPLFSMRTVLLASLQSCRSVDPDAWCKQALKRELTHRLTGDCSCTELKPLSSQTECTLTQYPLVLYKDLSLGLSTSIPVLGQTSGLLILAFFQKVRNISPPSPVQLLKL